jgi:hypothetical protein
VQAALVGAATAPVVALAWALGAYAGRLDRLHRRADGTAAALAAALERRAGAAGRLAAGGALDPAAARRLATAAAEAAARRGLGAERERVESGLSRELRAALTPAATAAVATSAGGPGLLGEVAGAGEQVVLARRLTNDAAVQARRVRAKRLVRWAHLAGRASAPTTVELDDQPPPAMAGHRHPRAHRA